MKRLVLTVHELAHSKSFNLIRRFASEEGDGNRGEKDLLLRYLPLKDQVMKTLRKKGYKIREGHSNFIIKCPFCTRERRSLYVSKDSGDYYCQPCKLKGTWKQLTNWESLAKPNSTNKTVSEEKSQQKQTPLLGDTTKPPSTQEECKITLDDGYFKTRTRKFTIKDKERLDRLTGTSCLAVSSLHLLDVRVEIPENETIESEDLVLAWPWFNNNFDQELVGVKIQHFGGVGKDGKQITYYPKDVKTGLFGWNTVAVQTKTVVITASELDAVALVQDCKAMEYVQKEKKLNPKPYLHQRDDSFLNRLRGVHITETRKMQGGNKPSEEPGIRHEKNKSEGKGIPLGKLDVEQITTILANKSSEPEVWTPDYVSKEFRIRLEHAAGLIQYFNTYVKPPVKKLEPPGDQEPISK